MADFFKYDIKCGDIEAQCGEPDATAGEKHVVVVPVQCGEDFMQCGEPDALAGLYESAQNNINLSALENQDTISATVKNYVGLSAAITEPVDAVALTAQAIVGLDLSTVENSDLLSAGVNVVTERNINIFSSERADAVIFTATAAQPRQRTFIPLSHYNFIPEINLKLKSSEARDKCKINIEAVPARAGLRIIENRDGVNIKAEYVENFYSEIENLILIYALMEAA